MHELSVDDKNTLALCSSDAVIDCLAGFKNAAEISWLPDAHPFPDGSLPNYASIHTGNHNQSILELISVRGPLHSIDGWSYLGRAFSALLKGQTHAARHLAYYAELRAALSILASSGIGVFNRKNVVVDSNGQIHTLSEAPTHQMAWMALSAWSDLPSSVEALLSPMKISGNSLYDGVRDFFPGRTSSSVRYFTNLIGFDLSRGSDDRDERNWSSYQPTALRPIPTLPKNDLNFIKMFWEALRPNSNVLERELLRRFLEAEILVSGQAVSLGELDDISERHSRLQNGIQGAVSIEFLTREIESTDCEFLLRVASDAIPAHPYDMMCRAGILLKFSTALSEGNMRKATLGPSDDFYCWWKDFGQTHGLWRPESPPEQTGDLWYDIEFALEDVASASTDHRLGWLEASGFGAIRVCEAERAALWGLFQ